MTGWQDLEAWVTVTSVAWNEQMKCDSSCFILHPAVGLPTLPSCADPSKSIQMQDSALLFWSHVQGTGGSFPSEGNLSDLIYVVSFSCTSRGRRDCCVQQLPKVMRIYSLQLTSSHKVLSWLYLFMVPSWCRFVRCIWSRFFFFLFHCNWGWIVHSDDEKLPHYILHSNSHLIYSMYAKRYCWFEIRRLLYTDSSFLGKNCLKNVWPISQQA